MKLPIPSIVAVLWLCQASFAQTDLGPLNLPNTAAALPIHENFEAAAGTVPAHMALTQLDAATLLHDAQSWCNIGQLGACSMPFGGSYNLEMGIIPGSTNYHYVRNAMVLYLDGSNASGQLTMSCMVNQFGEETHSVDGMWVSQNGTQWYPLISGWGSFSSEVWSHSSLLDLEQTTVDVHSTFYVAFVQEDNFPYGYLDGVGIDDIAIPGIPEPPRLSAGNFVAGQYSYIQMDSDFPNSFGRFLASLNGPGPTVLGSLVFELSQPILFLGDINTDSEGKALLYQVVPPRLAGSTVWLQAIAFNGAIPHVSNSLIQIVQ
jgi:hypothetical protein